MGLRQLPSGTWQYREQIDGKRYEVTFPKKPTKRQIDDAIFEKRKAHPKITSTDTFKQGALAYIESKDHILSPSTINSYYSLIRNLSDDFLALRIADIETLDIQREINTYAEKRSPKSVKNASGFITVVMHSYRPDMFINTKLPQNIKKEILIPTDAEVEQIVAELKDTPYEAATLLCMMGLRRSEAISITADDIKKVGSDYFLNIDKGTVVNAHGEYVTKTTKTVSSTRTIFLPPYLAELILRQGKAYEGFPNSILRNLKRIQKRLGIKETSLHALRHYYVSHAHALGIPDATIAKSVGHKNISTTQAIYTHAKTDMQLSYEKKATPF